MRAEILQQPWTERYFGPPPDWIEPGNAMVVFRRSMLTRLWLPGGGYLDVETPKGYISDRASVPRLAYLVATPAGDLELAAYPHDWLYSHGGRFYGVDKAFADRAFKAVLEATPTPIPSWKVNACYHAVRLGGQGGWKNGWADWPA